MAIYGTTITVPTITGTHSGYVAQIKTGDLPTDALNSANQVDNGGGNIQIYTDATKTTRLPIDIVECVTGGTPSFLAYVRMDSASTGADLYFVGDDVQTSQPAVGAAYGRNAVWSDYEAVIHANETGTNGVFVDSTGNGHDTTLSTGATLATVSTGHPWGGTWPDFTTSEALTLSASSALVNNSAFTLSIWCNLDTSIGSRGLFGNWSVGTLPDMTHMQTSTRRWSWDVNGSMLEHVGVNRALSTNTLVILESSSSGMRSFDNNVLLGTELGVGDTLNCVNPFVIGTYFSNSADRRMDGRFCEARIKRSIDSDDFKTTEYNNQSSATWFTNDGWNLESGVNTAQITESFPALVESISITATTLIDSTITEAFPSPTEASSVNISLTVTSAITEIFPSPTESINIVTGGIVTGQVTEIFPSLFEATSVNIKSTIVSNVTESFPALVEGINITIPGSVVINGKHILRVNAATKTVRINAVSKIKRFK